MVSIPPDLRVLHRKLTHLSHPDLLRALPSLTVHIIRSRDHLSAPSQDPKSKDGKSSSESSDLVHKVKQNIHTLLASRTIEGRFTAVALVKAVVDVGGWQILKDCQKWVQGLLAVVQVRLEAFDDGFPLHI